jgi:phosphoglycerate dehydrogenase-like enzyme
MPRLLILSQDAAEYKRLLTEADLPGLSIYATHDPSDTIPCGAVFDLLMGEPALISQVVACLPELRWAQCTWAGVEPLLRPGMRRDYTLTNVRHVYGPQMSEYVFGYLLLIERGMLSRWQAQQAGRWDTTLPGTLRRKTLGLLGVGSIGAHLAGTARHFGMHVRGYTRFSESCPDVGAYFHGEALSEFAAGLDYLVCVLPGTNATRHLVDASLLAALPPHAWLVNIGRGSAVDEAALVAALEAGRLGGAVMDVFQQEPLPPEHPLWRTPNTFITAHVAAKNYLPDIARLFCENYLRFLLGEPLRGQVDFELGY